MAGKDDVERRRGRHGPLNDSKPCPVCDESSNGDDRWICCERCRTWIHAPCANLTDELFLFLGNTKNLLFVCDNCLKVPKKTMLSDIDCSNMKEEIVRTVKNTVRQIIHQEQGSLQEAAKVNHYVATAGKEGTRNTEPTKPFRAAIETGIRIRGLPEPTSKSVNERLFEDKSQIEDIFRHLEVSCEIYEVQRIGKYAKDKNRLVIATVDSVWSKRKVLMSLAKLRDYKLPIFISSDLSSTEVEKEQKALKQRHEHIARGIDRKDLRIRNLVLEKKLGEKFDNVISIPPRPDSPFVSFHVVCYQKSHLALMNPDVWSEGVLIRYYRLSDDEGKSFGLRPRRRNAPLRD